MPVTKTSGGIVTSGISGNGSGIGGSDFTILSAPKRQCVALIMGEPKTGKTTFVTDYCPGPVAFINYDGRAEHAIKRALDNGRRIYYLKIDYAADDITRLD